MRLGSSQVHAARSDQHPMVVFHGPSDLARGIPTILGQPLDRTLPRPQGPTDNPR